MVCAGQEYSTDLGVCVTCAGGSQRMVGREDFCVPCNPGYYSDVGATNCTACPLNQFAPVYGMRE